MRKDGGIMQVTLNGWPLCRFAKDTAPGQANVVQGIGKGRHGHPADALAGHCTVHWPSQLDTDGFAASLSKRYSVRPWAVTTTPSLPTSATTRPAPLVGAWFASGGLLRGRTSAVTVRAAGGKETRAGGGRGGDKGEAARVIGNLLVGGLAYSAVTS
jgi:hypothetical protein